MQYVIMAVVGLIVGFIARFLMPGAQHMGLITTALLGIAGSYLAGFVGGMIHKNDDGGFAPAGFLYSIVGAFVLLFIALKTGLVH